MIHITESVKKNLFRYMELVPFFKFCSTGRSLMKITQEENENAKLQ
jgi:hypothetical protein